MRNSAVKKNDNEWIKRNFKKCSVYTKWTKKIFGCTEEKLKSADNTSLKSIDQSGSRQQTAAGGGPRMAAISSQQPAGSRGSRVAVRGARGCGLQL